MYVFAVRMPYKKKTGGNQHGKADTGREARHAYGKAQAIAAARTLLASVVRRPGARLSARLDWRQLDRPPLQPRRGRRYLAIGPADDTLDAGALSFDTAQAKARAWLATVPAEQGVPAGPLTVARACDDYLAFLRHDGRSDAAIRDAAYRIEAFIRPTLGRREVQSLKADELRRWRDQIASTPALTPNQERREAKAPRGCWCGQQPRAPRHRQPDLDRIPGRAQSLLHRGAGAVRCGVAQGQAVPRGGERTHPVSDGHRGQAAHQRVQSCSASSCSSRPQTGARYGELARLEIRDFNPDAGTLTVRQSKAGKPRHVVLTAEGHALFSQLTAGRAGDEVRSWAAGPSRSRSAR